ncbi:hypothetical protein BKA70DRAFT_1045666, partial [Coprinopsis sp. MPI-PUGE-AT-0042]
ISVTFLHLGSSNHTALAFFSRFVSHMATSLGIPIAKALHLPTQQGTSAILCSPFRHKKSPERFDTR